MVIRINDAIVRLLNLIGARPVTRLAEVHKPTSPRYAVGPSGRRRRAGSDAESSAEDGWGGFGVEMETKRSSSGSSSPVPSAVVYGSSAASLRRQAVPSTARVSVGARRKVD